MVSAMAAARKTSLTLLGTVLVYATKGLREFSVTNACRDIMVPIVSHAMIVTAMVCVLVQVKSLSLLQTEASASAITRLLVKIATSVCPAYLV